MVLLIKLSSLLVILMWTMIQLKLSAQDKTATSFLIFLFHKSERMLTIPLNVSQLGGIEIFAM